METFSRFFILFHINHLSEMFMLYSEKNTLRMVGNDYLKINNTDNLKLIIICFNYSLMLSFNDYHNQLLTF